MEKPIRKYVKRGSAEDRRARILEIAKQIIKLEEELTTLLEG